MGMECSSSPILLSDFSDLVVSSEIQERIERLLIEYRNRNKLQKYGLSNRRKILIEGRPGTGKTFTASVIAAELDLPLYTIQMDKVVTKFMGETSTKLRQIFDNISTSTGVYFFDEFDAIGADRSLDNEVGEARRILNSFLQFIEQDTSDSIIIAATNNQKLLDQALFRRFDDVLHYAMPTSDEVRRLFEIRLGTFDSSFKVSDETIRMASKLSHAEIIRVCDDAIKNSILMNTKIDNVYLLKMLKDRINAYIAKEHDLVPVEKRNIFLHETQHALPYVSNEKDRMHRFLAAKSKGARRFYSSKT